MAVCFDLINYDERIKEKGYMIFKCKSCGGNILYNPEKQAMVCPFCESKDTQVRKEASAPGLGICPECGGEVPVDTFDSATKCPYCDNYLIFNERVEGEYEPAYVIPFLLGKEFCKESIRDKFKKFIFAPTDFLSDARLDTMQGFYVPYWFYDCDTDVHYTGEATKVRSWTSGDTRYTETSYYHVIREVEIPFEKVPADASIKMPDDVMDLMEPYDYSKLQAFQPEYLSGFYAERYNMPAQELEGRAKKKMEEAASVIVNRSISGYSSVRQTGMQMNSRDGETKYGLLPVWKYTYLYGGKEYPFYVNGQSGKIVGSAPISKPKVMAYSATLWAVLTVILAAINGVLGLL